MPTIADVRAQYPQYDDMSDGELAAALHSKFYSDMPAAEFAVKVGLEPPEPVKTNSIVRSLGTGIPIVGGLLNKADAATNAFLAPALNSLFDEKDQLPETTFGERYAHSLRDQQGMDAKFTAQHPVVDTGAKITGAVASMIPPMAAAPAAFGLTGGFGRQMLNGGLSNAALGGADATVRGDNPIPGAAVGGALGAVAPILAAVGHAALAPIASNIAAAINPAGYAARQVARAVGESGLSTSEIADRMIAANADGQAPFMLVDALENPAQRLLSTVARAPGPGRTAVVDALENRQSGQGRRIASTLTEGFETPETAAQLERRLTAARSDDANAAYSAVRDDAGRVDVTGAIDHIDRTLGPGADQMLANAGSAAANDGVEAILQTFRNRLARVNPDDFASVQRIRGEMSDAAQNAAQNGYGNRARLLRGALGRLDSAMEEASPGYRAANAKFSQASRDIDSIDQGRDAAMRGRTEDTIPAFRGLSPNAQRAFRTGYADNLIADVQKTAPGVNKARPLLNDAIQDESAVMAPRNAQMQRRLMREDQMFRTRNEALGNSKTAENLADADALGIDPSFVGHLLHGNYVGAARQLVQAGSNLMSGNTSAVRARLADLLLQHGADVTPASLDRMIGETLRQVQRIQRIGATARGTAQATAAVAPETLSQKRRLTRRN